MICRPVAIYLHTSIGDTRLQLNQIVKKQFSSYDMSVKEISLFGIRHFPILLLVASPKQKKKSIINHQPRTRFYYICFQKSKPPTNVDYPERNNRDCLREKRNFVRETGIFTVIIQKEIIEIVCRKKGILFLKQKKLLVLIHPIHQCFINPSIHSYNKQPIFENHLTIHTISHH